MRHSNWSKDPDLVILDEFSYLSLSAFRGALLFSCWHILEPGNDSFRFKNSSAKAAKPTKEKSRNLTNA